MLETPPAKAPVERERRSATDLERLQRLARERAHVRPSDAYKLGPGDLVEINVFDLPEMNRKVRVGQSGYVQLPLIGAVRARGKSESELGWEIARRLKRDYLHNPQVDVFVEEYKSQQVAVTGAVDKPGLYPLTRERYTILDMVSEAGGLTKDAGSVIEFIPAGAAKSNRAFAVASASDSIAVGTGSSEVLAAADAISIEVNDLLRGGSDAELNVAVGAGDVIFVPEAGSFTIEGWVDKPGTYPLTRNTTVLAAISSGGGPLLPARLGSVVILRKDGTEEREAIPVNLHAVRDGRTPDVQLRSGDIVRVPSNPLLLPPWGVYAVIRDLIRIGASVPLI